MPLHLKHVPARRGLLWVRQGLRTFARRPLAFTALLMPFVFAWLVAMMLPLLAVLVVAALPLLTLAFMLGTQAALRDEPVHPGLVFLPLRAGARRRPLLLLCALYALAALAIAFVGFSVDGDSWERVYAAMNADKATPEQVQGLLSDPSLLWGIWLRLALTALVSVPFWHAPALVQWGGQSVGQSLFSSTLACWRNRGAFTLYALGWLALTAGFALLASLVFALLGNPGLLRMAVLPAALMFTTAFYASLYFTFVDSFASDAPTPAEA